MQEVTSTPAGPLLSPDVVRYVVPALLGLVGGLVGSLVGPLVQWAVEKRRRRMEYRRAQIEAWRDWLGRVTFGGVMDLKRTSMYRRMRPHLSAETREQLEAEVPGETLGERQNVVYGRMRLLDDELARLEQRWGLL